MPISAMDESMAHQTPETFARVCTSDRNFYDRYYFNLHPESGAFFMVIGIGQYPNPGTTDAFAPMVKTGKQTVLRCSRELGADRSDTTVGPFGAEVVEPHQSLRFRHVREHLGRVSLPLRLRLLRSGGALAVADSTVS